MPRKKGVPYARDELKERHAFSITRKAYDGFKRLSKRLKLSMSALLEALGRGELFLTRHPHSFEDVMLTWDMDELAQQAGIPVERLIDIRDGKGDHAQFSELIGLARATGISFDQLKKLATQGERQSNGC
jgi:hypothetical protein